MDATNTAYIGAIGALLGVVVTTSAQAIVGRLQRRQDRATKLFETKLELYMQFAAALRQSADAFAMWEPLNEKWAEAIAGTDQFIEELKNEQLSKLATVLGEEFDEIGAATTEFAEKAHSAAKRMAELSPRIALIADSRLRDELAILFKKLGTNRFLSESDFDAYNRAARSELGVRTTRLRSRIRRRTAMYRLRRRAMRKTSRTGPNRSGGTAKSGQGGSCGDV